MKIKAGSKLLMIGDSITDAGRKQPIGEGLGDALGTGYVNLVNATLGAARPDLRIRVVNMGTSGNTVRQLRTRWQHDVLDHAPDWLSIMIGINDVWRQHDSPLQVEIHVGIEEYEQTLIEMIEAVVGSLDGLVLMTPFFIEAQRDEAMRVQMDTYGGVVRKLAKRYDAVFVDTQQAFDRVLEHTHSAALAWDRIHPNTVGHMVLARAFLDAVGFA